MAVISTMRVLLLVVLLASARAASAYRGFTDDEDSLEFQDEVYDTYGEDDGFESAYDEDDYETEWDAADNKPPPPPPGPPVKPPAPAAEAKPGVGPFAGLKKRWPVGKHLPKHGAKPPGAPPTLAGPKELDCKCTEVGKGPGPTKTLVCKCSDAPAAATAPPGGPHFPKFPVGGPLPVAPAGAKPPAGGPAPPGGPPAGKK